jgi:hypothetical protein
MGAGTSSANIFNVKGAEGDYCNPTGFDTFKDAWGGFDHGVLSMVGLGFLVDPIAPLQDDISKAQGKLQNIYNSNGLAFAKNQSQINQIMEEIMSTNKEILEEMMEINQEITNENLGKINITLASIGILVLIMVIYVLTFT